jgi:hypothetical protein
MLSELIEITSSLEFEEYGGIELVAVRLDGDVLTLSLHLDAGNESDGNEAWEIECFDPLEHRLTTLGHFDTVDLTYDHVLLWPFLYPWTSMSFYGEASEPLAVVDALRKLHLKLTRDLVPFDKFMNGNTVEMIQGRYGMLAAGPTVLVESYAQVLESFGIGTALTTPQSAHYTNDELSGLQEVALLTLSNGTYVVATKFKAHRLPGN